jgi:hypothetical protein
MKIDMNHQQETDLQRFVKLKEKYKATNYKDSSTSSPLYFILRKADLGVKLYDPEKKWLSDQNLSKTLLIIQERYQYINQEGTQLSTEFSKLKLKYKANVYSDLWISSPLYFILLKLDTGISLTTEELNWLLSKNLNETNLIAHKISNFRKLKTKYKVSQHKDFFPDSPLHTILKKIDKSNSLTASEYQWLVNNQLSETLEFAKQQEIKKENEFATLKEKYQAVKYKTKEVSSPLYLILKNLDKGNTLNNTEIEWLNKQELIETLAIYEERQQTQEFAKLKIKYKATSYEDISPKCHLYKVLKMLESSNLLSIQDVNFLKKRGLHETIEFTNDKYAKNLRIKIHQLKSLEQLESFKDREIEWLRTNNYQEIINLVETQIDTQKFIQLKLKFDISNNRDNSPNDPLYLILQKLESNERVEPIDVAWLQEKGLFFGKIRVKYYSIEADFYQQEYKQTGNKWNLVNASSHLRKAEKSKLALRLTDILPIEGIKEKKLKAALLTTRGGAYRDIEELDNAENCAFYGIELQPSSHHPYTLMGAICYDRHQHSEGDEWFRKAIERGASPKDVDAEIKSVLKKIKDKKQIEKLLEHLLKTNLKLHRWAQDYLKKGSNNK